MTHRGAWWRGLSACGARAPGPGPGLSNVLLLWRCSVVEAQPRGQVWLQLDRWTRLGQPGTVPVEPRPRWACRQTLLGEVVEEQDCTPRRVGGEAGPWGLRVKEHRQRQ